MFTKWLQDAFKCPLVIQLTDDEKCLVKGLDVEEARRLAVENCKDIIACGFDISRTFIFSDFEYVGGAFYRVINRIQAKVRTIQAKGLASCFVPAALCVTSEEDEGKTGQDKPTDRCTSVKAGKTMQHDPKKP
jgi:hypothetical protein